MARKPSRREFMGTKGVYFRSRGIGSYITRGRWKERLPVEVAFERERAS